NSDAEKEEILEVAELIKSEVNVKELEVLKDASDIIVKQIKPNYKTLGPRFGKDMKAIAAAIGQLSEQDIQQIEQQDEFEVAVNGKNINLTRDDVEISSKDIEGWLVASSGKLTVALDITLNDDLKSEGIARELVNRIQNLRKDSGFEITDRITVKLEQDSDLEFAINKNLEYIKTETLTEKIDILDKVESGIEIAFDDVETKLSIQKY
ncbi:MAG: DUF5915 domain-containing protein, partial [Flavobacteriaceae bacterium]|nr:DUF5915 domain-containing protein [Flavobacteriaceae bacterium]